jgi:adenosylcobalamin-dependent ribonucleoside-triphosphate reductase
VKDFRLSEKFLDDYQDKDVPWGYGDLSYTTFKSKYARHLNDDPAADTEEWWECVRRVVEGVFSIQKRYCHEHGLEWLNQRGQKSAQIMYDKIFHFKFTPPGRGLFIMGSPVVELRGSAALQNCAFISTKNLHLNFTEPFMFLMDMSMCGVGVGFDTKGTGKVVIQERSTNGSTLLIDDSREGWVDALRVTLESYAGGPSYKLDYSKIRPKGSPIKTFGGVAPGPAILKKLCEKSIPSILEPLVGEEITSTAIVDLMNHIGVCVVSGNVRRSAELAIGDWNDSKYIEMKNHKKHGKALKSHRWMSNNSIFAHVGMDYTEIGEHISTNGEPGCIWMENVHSFGRRKDGFDDTDEAEGFNPCVEQPIESHECCTLVELYPGNHESPEEFIETVKFAYMYGKTVTLVSTHNKKSNQVMMKNRRIGTSMSGIEQAITKFGKRVFFREFCDAGYVAIRNWDRIYSNWLGVPRSVRVTTVKPSGTVSLLAGASPGIHKPNGRKYIRYVGWERDHRYIDAFKSAGFLVEENIRSEDKTELMVLFPVEETKPCRYTEEETNIWEQFQLASDMQYWWSDNGVSCTVKFDPETEKNQISDCLATYESRLKAISLLPKSGHRYLQCPYTMVSDNYKKQDRYIDGHRIIWTTEEFETYRRKINSVKLREELARIAIDAAGEKGCTNDTCEVEVQHV